MLGDTFLENEWVTLDQYATSSKVIPTIGKKNGLGGPMGKSKKIDKNPEKKGGHDTIGFNFTPVKETDNSNVDAHSIVKLQEWPSPRAAHTFLSLKGNSFVVFGGEYYDSKVCRVFNDTFKWNPTREDSWQYLEKGIKPNARVGHAAVVTASDQVYIFGGEFATKSEFQHYNDFWILDAKKLVWRPILDSTSKDAPSARSGHRMAMCRNMIVLFGGFIESKNKTKYLNDLHVYRISDGAWRTLDSQSSKQTSTPCPRSGSILGSTDDGIFVHGGFSKIRESHNEVQGITHNDSWWLNMLPVIIDPIHGIPTWESLSSKGAPHRSGCGVTQSKNLIFVFGGVIDNDEGGLNIVSSIFYNDFYVFDLNTRKWCGSGDSDGNEKTNSEHYGHYFYGTSLRKFKLNVMKPFKSITVVETTCQSEKSRKGKFPNNKKVQQLVVREVGEAVDVSQNPKEMKEPLPRYQSSICVKGTHIYMMGGSLELGKRTLVFDDIWKFDMTLHNWENVHPGTYWQDNNAPHSDASGSNTSSSETNSSNDDASDTEDSDSE